MRMKWIVATVPDGQRAAFSRAQAAWTDTALCTGFIGQAGGWDAEGRACILGVWHDAAAADRFMAHVHDAITNANQQADAYTHLEVVLADGLLRMPGGARTLSAALPAARFLRVADCTIHAPRRSAFVGAQLRVWAPGMAACPGMLGGLFSSAGPERYLVTSLWESEAHHQAYVDGPFADLRAQADAAGDLKHITGHRVLLETSWGFGPRG